MAIKCGSLVYLKSGGPPMTVSRFGSDAEFQREHFAGLVQCNWFVGVDLKTHWFHIEMLTEACDSDKGASPPTTAARAGVVMGPDFGDD